MLLITDLDGTLIDSKRAISNSAIATVVKFAGLNLPESFFYPFIGIPIKNVLKDLIPPERLEESVLYFRGHLIENGESLTHPFPGVFETLQELNRRGGVVCVASNKVSSLAATVLNQQGLGSLIRKIYGTNNHAPKPNPEMVIKAMSDFPNRRTFMIGDRPEDMIAGKEAGAETIFFSNEFSPLLGIVGLDPDKRVDSWSHLLELPGFFKE